MNGRYGTVPSDVTVLTLLVENSLSVKVMPVTMIRNSPATDLIPKVLGPAVPYSLCPVSGSDVWQGIHELELYD